MNCQQSMTAVYLTVSLQKQNNNNKICFKVEAEHTDSVVCLKKKNSIEFNIFLSQKTCDDRSSQRQMVRQENHHKSKGSAVFFFDFFSPPFLPFSIYLFIIIIFFSDAIVLKIGEEKNKLTKGGRFSVSISVVCAFEA